MSAYPFRIYSQLRENYTIHHIINFSLTFLGVATVIASWKTLANVTPALVSEWTPESDESISPSDIWQSQDYFLDDSKVEFFLGGINFCFLIFNGIGLYVAGAIGDRYITYRKFQLIVAMTASLIITYLFGVLQDRLSYFNKGYLAVLWSLNGLAQAPTIPLSLAIMGNWFGKSRRGVVFGIWSASMAFGSILSSLMSFWTLTYGHRLCFTVNLTLLLSVIIFLAFGLTTTPESLGLNPALVFETFNENEIDSDTEGDILSDSDSHHGNMLNILSAQMNGGPISPNPSMTASDDHSLLFPGSSISSSRKQILLRKAINLKDLLTYPGVAVYTLSYTSLKIVVYTLLLWLPYYLTKEFDFSGSHAVRCAAFFDIGNIFGGIILGVLFDWLKWRNILLTIGIFTSILFCTIFCVFVESTLAICTILTFVGITLGGCSNFLFGPVKVELSQKLKQSRQQELNESLSTISGLMEGTATLGAAIAQLIVPLLMEENSSKDVLTFLLILLLCSAGIITFHTLKDVGEVWIRFKQTKNTDVDLDVD